MGRAPNRCLPIPFAILLALAAATVSGQEGASAKPGPKAKVGSGDGVPGAMVMLPLSLENASGADIAEIVSQISFPAQARFIRFEPAASLKAAGTDASAKNADAPPGGKPAPGEKHQVAEIRITRTREAAKLQDGPLGQLVFTVEADALGDGDSGGELALSYDVTIAAFGGGDTRVTTAKYSDAAKIVLASATVPVTACFFYMH